MTLSGFSRFFQVWELNKVKMWRLYLLAVSLWTSHL
jgi:hypothetical protein